MSHLKLVDDAYRSTRRAYVLFVDPDQEFLDQLSALEANGRYLVNGDEGRGIDQVDMRLHVQGLTVADDLVLPDIWWTNARAHMLVQLAGWLGIKLITVTGTEIPTASARGRL